MFLRLRIFEFLFRVFLTVVREFIRRHKATVQASGENYPVSQLSALPRRVLRLPANQIERAATVRNTRKINYIRNGRDTRAHLVHQYKDTEHKRRKYVGKQTQGSCSAVPLAEGVRGCSGARECGGCRVGIHGARRFGVDCKPFVENG